MTFHQGCCLCATGWSGEGFDFSPRNNQRLKLLRNATLTPHATPTKTERRGARCPAPFEIAALPFLWPTRLADGLELEDRKSTRLNSSHSQISYAVFCLKKKKN